VKQRDAVLVELDSESVERIAGGDGGPATGGPTTGPRRTTRGQRLTGGLFIAAGLNHFVVPRAYRTIVPPGFGDPAQLVAISGVAEVAGGVGVLLPRTRRLSGLGLIALLLAVFPANLYMARNPERFGRIPRWALYARLPLQPLMVWGVWRATRRSSS
jgi:uncharacterized membrane protein